MTFEHYNDGVNHFLRFYLEDAFNLDVFKHNMMAKLENGLLPCRLVEEGSTCFEYRLDDGVCLTQFLKNRQITMALVIDILKQINYILLSLLDYLLEPQDIYFDSDCIFIHPYSKKISLVYIPIKSKIKYISYKKWTTSLIKSLSHYISSSYRLSELYTYLTSNDFCIEGFQSLLKSIKENVQFNHEPIEKSDKEQMPTSEKNKSKLQKCKKKILITKISFIFFHILIILICSVIFVELDRVTADLLEARLAVILIALSLDILITKNFFLKHQIIKAFNLKQFKLNHKALKKIKNHHKSKLNLEKYHDETSVLLDKRVQSPYLVMKDSGVPIFLDKPRLVIGRQREAVDIFIESHAVGRRHCQLIKDVHSYVLVDSFSKNGTYVNGSKVDVETPVPLSHGDIIKIANVELVYHVQ